ncbi:hypothetical protein AB1Y20_016249 [Prymnesium parvum]|uniref:Haem-binding uptake Tiki superfamily ChaN domain-containing protein n=1 Tax=Prymnesium parvum TaxID=97485 RepID=A0AB34ICA5_PRYPA
MRASRASRFMLPLAFAFLHLLPSTNGVRPAPRHSAPSVGRRGALAAAGALAGGCLAQHAAELPSDSLDPSSWPLDASQWTSYDPRRALLYDTRAGSFLPADPRRLIATALQKRSLQTEAVAAAASADGGAAEARVLFAAEARANPMHHAAQLEMIKAVHRLDERPLAIGMQMFWRQHQPALDQFVYGDGSFSQLLRATNWDTSWGYDFNQYAKILAYARKHQLQVVGLSPPTGLVRLVAARGLEATIQTRVPLPEMDLTNREHFQRYVAGVAAAGGGRGGLTQAGLLRGYQALTLDDEYMAESIARYLAYQPNRVLPAGEGSAPLAASPVSSPSPAPARTGSCRMVALMETRHVRGRVGVPNRLTRRIGEPTFSMIPQSVAWATTGLPAIERPLDGKEADWVLYTQSEIHLAKGARSPPVPDTPRLSYDFQRSAKPIQI